MASLETCAGWESLSLFVFVVRPLSRDFRDEQRNNAAPPIWGWRRGQHSGSIGLQNRSRSMQVCTKAVVPSQVEHETDETIKDLFSLAASSPVCGSCSVRRNPSSSSMLYCRGGGRLQTFVGVFLPKTWIIIQTWRLWTLSSPTTRYLAIECSLHCRAQMPAPRNYTDSYNKDAFCCCQST